jgi:hypothetical protein
MNAHSFAFFVGICWQNFMPELDEMLSLTEAAEWLGLHRRILLKKIKGRRPIIPAFKLSRREYRFNPRAIIVRLAIDAGVPREEIALYFVSIDTVKPKL